MMLVRVLAAIHHFEVIMPKTKTNQDKALIKKLFAVDPIDYARYPDGTLAFISPTGQKFSYTPALLVEIEAGLNQKAANQKKPPKSAAPKPESLSISKAKK